MYHVITLFTEGHCVIYSCIHERMGISIQHQLNKVSNNSGRLVYVQTFKATPTEWSSTCLSDKIQS